MDENNFQQVKVNREFLAEIFNCEVRTVQNFAKLYGMPRDERGEYPLFECLIWFIKKQKKDYDELSNDNPLTRARIDAIELNNQKKKLEMETAAGNLLDKNKVEVWAITTIKMIMRNAEAIAPRLNKKLSGDSKSLSIIKSEIDEFRNFCADTPMKYYEDEFEKMFIEKENN